MSVIITFNSRNSVPYVLKFSEMIVIKLNHLRPIKKDPLSWNSEFIFVTVKETNLFLVFQ